jgi:DNA processing protein
LRCLASPQLAVVGSRKASPSGLRGARELSLAVSQQGLTVTSGLAIGIDGEAHRAALSAGGTTVAVMAGGLDSVYPRRHRDLAEAIAMQGCLVSEFAVGTPPIKHHFPQRNRIISGLALATLIVEAALPSGSLITAQTALAQGRDVLALPWSMYHHGGHGCLQLLQDGAGLVRNADDILLALARSPLRLMCPAPDSTGSRPTAEPEGSQSVVTRAAVADLPARQRDVLALVGAEPIALEQLAQFSSESPSSLLASLSSLELQGLIERVGGAYVRL